jgi:hypothetical protein
VLKEYNKLTAHRSTVRIIQALLICLQASRQ